MTTNVNDMLVGNRPRRAYISGAISGNTGESRERKLRKFAEAQAFLEGKGYAVVNPLEVQPCADNSCLARDGAPEPGSDQQDSTKVHSWECYMRNDIIALMSCDEIWMIPGWEASNGANIERDLAHDLNMDLHALTIENLHSGAATLGTTGRRA